MKYIVKNYSDRILLARLCSALEDRQAVAGPFNRYICSPYYK